MDLPYILNNHSVDYAKFGAAFLQDNPSVVPYVALLVIFTIIGTGGNVLIILSIGKTKTLKTSSNILIVNLAVADLCVCALINPLSIVGVLTGEKWFTDRFWLCEAIASVCLTSCFCSLLTIGTISVNRYINICHNQYYSRIYTRTYTIIMAVMLWVVSFALEMPNFVGWGDHVFDTKALGCVWDRTADHSYSIFFSCTAVGMPLIMISTCYVKIFQHVRSSKRKIAAMSKAVAGSKMMKERIESIQLARSLFIIFVVFFLCWTPYALVVSLDPTDEYTAAIHLYTMLFAHANSSLNSVVYGVTNKTFRSAYYSILCCTRLKSQMDNTKTVPTATVTEMEGVMSIKRTNISKGK